MKRLSELLRTPIPLPPIPPQVPLIAFACVEAWYFAIAVVFQVVTFQQDVELLISHQDPDPIVGSLAEPRPVDYLAEVVIWSLLLTLPIVIIRFITLRRWVALCSPVLGIATMLVIFFLMAFSASGETILFFSASAAIPQILLNAGLLLGLLKNSFYAQKHHNET